MKTKCSPGMIAIYAMLSAWAVTTIYPFVWVILNSFRVKGEIRTDSFSIPSGDSFTMDNYTTAFDRSDILQAYTNSMVISLSVTFFVVLFAGVAAYALVRYNFRGKNLVNGMIIASMMVPAFATIVPVFTMEAAWGIAGDRTDLVMTIANAIGKVIPSIGEDPVAFRALRNEIEVNIARLSVILPQIAGNLAFAMVVLSGFMRSLPVETEESAYLDGCNIYQIYFKIVMPMARPSFATVSIFAFLWSYNDLFTQSFFLRLEEHHTVTLLLNQISSQAGTDYGLMAAAVVLVVVPVVIVYILLQKNIIKGMTVGAVKG